MAEVLLNSSSIRASICQLKPTTVPQDMWCATDCKSRLLCDFADDSIHILAMHSASSFGGKDVLGIAIGLLEIA